MYIGEHTEVHMTVKSVALVVILPKKSTYSYLFRSSLLFFLMGRQVFSCLIDIVVRS